MKFFFHGAWFYEITRVTNYQAIWLLQAGNLQVAIHGRDHNVMGPGWGLWSGKGFLAKPPGILHKVIKRA